MNIGPARDIQTQGAAPRVVPPEQRIDPRVAYSHRLNLRVRNALAFHAPTLAQLLEDDALPAVPVRPAGDRVAFRWRLEMRLGDETLLQLGLSDAVLAELGVDGDPTLGRAGAEVAAALMAPVLRRLRTWVDGMPTVVVTHAPGDRLEMGSGALFRLVLSGRAGAHSVPAQMSQRIAARMLERLGERRRPLARHLPLAVHLGRQVRLRATDFLALQPGDVLLQDRGHRAATVDVLVMQHVGAEVFTPVARLDRSSGRSVGGIGGAGERDIGGRGPMVCVEILEARGTATTTALRALQPSMRPRFWTACQWFERAELRVGGCTVGWARPTQVAGSFGHEIVAFAGQPVRN